MGNQRDNNQLVAKSSIVKKDSLQNKSHLFGRRDRITLLCVRVDIQHLKKVGRMILM